MEDHQQHCIVALVDDDACVRESLEHLLYAVEIEDRPFSSAEEALQPGKLDSVNCLVTDVRMLGMNGCELQRRLVATLPTRPAIFVTAHPDDKVSSRALAQGAFAFLYKPIDGEEFLRTVRPSRNGAAASC
ncbi:response regulator transcription factor [Edaphobacter albus]|uniref:response regulator transcription factor n=1 Tax=Edaphobacter sp. 4G125 TaxID=2763071 RepID=UPI0016442A8B|nr:response regulator [Edaphobacter sp. 4G125]QNI37999.1 response regulator [Edaphobacter sp. 4G125]